MQKKETLCIMV